MKTIIKFIIPILCFGAILFTIVSLDDITNYIIPFIKQTPEIVIPKTNEYKKEDSFLFVQNTDNFTPYSKQDLKNIFYTIVNNGWTNFSFYCPKEYSLCLEDVKELSKNQVLLTHINNFVHPYNGFSNILSTISESGLITVDVTYFYTKDHIEAINKKIDEIYNEIITNDMDKKTKIKTIHDYIINNTKYDVTRNEKGSSSYQSYLAYGALFEGYATCNGYTDAMALFLEKMHIKNYKIATTPEDLTKEGHVWNAVYLNGKWYHLDLTWNDPISNDNKDYLLDTYFLITNEQLEENDNGETPITEHQFKKDIYLEFQ